MRLTRAFSGAFVAMLAVVAACADGPTSSANQAGTTFKGIDPVDPAPGAILRGVETERYELCKDYVGEVGPTVTFDIAVTGGTVSNHQALLDDGECEEIWQNDGVVDNVAVTENVPAGYIASYVRTTRTGGITTVYAPVVSNTVPALPVIGGTGQLVVFTNTLDVPPDNGCTLTQGYWKNHGEDWDEVADANTMTFLTTTTFFNSGVSYLTILDTPPKKGNAYLQLAHQYIAAQLNLGTSPVPTAPAEVTAAIAGATAYFTGAPAGIPNPTDPTRSMLQGWATTLDDWNNGITGPGHCND